MKELFRLFSTFFQIGICTFGGGYAMLPMLEREIVNKRGWASMEELLDYFAIGQCTPGIIAVNTATFVGYKQRGILGGIVATLGMVAPSLLVITVIAALLANFMEYEGVRYAFAGIHIAVCALIAGSIVKLCKSSVKAWWQGALAALAFIAAGLLQVNTIAVVAATIAGALLCYALTRKKEGKKA